MVRVSELHWWEGRHRQCCSSIAGVQHQPHEEKEGRSHKTPALGEGGVPWRERGVPETLEPSPGYAPDLLPFISQILDLNCCTV